MSRILGEQIRDKAVLHWVADKGDQTLSLEHPSLGEDSLVVDFGGYTGEWAHKIFTRYGCFIEIYEPAHNFVLEIEKRFAKQLNDKVKVVECAVGAKNERANLAIDGLATSIIKSEDGRNEGSISVVDVTGILGSRKVDLLKMNIEGSEYEVFDSLFENSLVANIDSIFVQFHPVDNDSIDKYSKIADRLSSTHNCVFRYPFIWEKWSLK